MRIACLLLIVASCAAAQTADLLTFTGSPLVVPFPCNDEDLEWAGLACTEEPCTVYLELSHAAGQGNTILVTGEFHAPTATLDSLLLRTTDGGKTWQEPFERMRGAELDRIQMYDAQTGWIGGQVMQPLALDPFLLLTTDGGKSWRRVPFFEEEGTPGSVLGFHFDSREHGVAIVDRGGGSKRYVEYETNTGGSEWAVHGQFDKQPRLPETPETVWRVQAESKLFRLEHEEEGSWHPFASFALHAATCGSKPGHDGD